MRLYSFWRSSCSWRVRIALALKRVDYEYRPVHLREHHQDGPAHEAINPMRQVPTLEWDEGGVVRRLSQSVAICEYLDARFPDPPLFPGDPFLAAKTRQLVEMVNAGIQPLQNLGLTEHLEALGLDAPQIDAWCRHWVDKGLAALEAEVAPLAGPFCVGGQPSLADACLVPQLYNARRFGLDLARCPKLVAAERACERIPAFGAAHPDRQPDAGSG